MRNRSLPATCCLLPDVIPFAPMHQSPFGHVRSMVRLDTFCKLPSHGKVLCMLILTDPDAGMEFHTDTSSSVEEGFLSTFATHLRPAFAQSESLCTSASMGVVYPSYRKTSERRAEVTCRWPSRRISCGSGSPPGRLEHKGAWRHCHRCPAEQHCRPRLGAEAARRWAHPVGH